MNELLKNLGVIVLLIGVIIWLYRQLTEDCQILFFLPV